MKYLATRFLDIDSMDRAKDAFEKKAFLWLHIGSNSPILSAIFSDRVRSKIYGFSFKSLLFTAEGGHPQALALQARERMTIF